MVTRESRWPRAGHGERGEGLGTVPGSKGVWRARLDKAWQAGEWVVESEEHVGSGDPGPCISPTGPGQPWTACEQ